MRQPPEYESNLELLLEALIKMVGRCNYKTEELSIRIKQLECMLIEVHTDSKYEKKQDLQLSASR